MGAASRVIIKKCQGTLLAGDGSSGYRTVNHVISALRLAAAITIWM